MKNMVILIDTNVLLNYLTNRQDEYLEQSIKIVEMCARGICVGYIAFHTISTLWYVLRKRSDKERRQNLRDICEIFSVASVPKNEIIDAINRDFFRDFEDCLQDRCAEEVSANYIFTRNTADFEASVVSAIEPDEWLKKLN